MTRKKIAASLTALCCTFSIGSLSASAQTDIISNEEGTLVSKTTTSFVGVMIETDGTELTEEVASSFEGFQSLQKYEDFSRDYCEGNVVTNITPDGTAYMFHTENSDTDALIALGREIMMKLDYVTEVHLVDKIVYQPVSLGYMYVLETLNPNTNVDGTSFPELEGMQIGGSNGSYSILMSNETIKEMKSQYTEYELYLQFSEFSDTMMEKYGDVLKFFTPSFTSLDSDNTNFTVSSVWTDAGDSNSDGTVDSTDAAEMLVFAAQIGTGVDVAVTSAADVNADGLLNAEDAAAVLSYAAAKGTGADVSWVDILRR